MNKRTNKKTAKLAVAMRQICFALIMTGIMSLAAFAQEVVSTKDPKPMAIEVPKTPIVTPLIKDINGVTLGMSQDEVKDVLGKPKVGDKSGFFYRLKGDESIQIEFNKLGKVKMVAHMYTKDAEGAPDFYDVFDKSVQLTPTADGRIYKLVKYPQAGYWLTYSMLKLKSGQMTTVTMQKPM